MIKNTNIRLELVMDEIKNNIQKNRLRQFGHVMRIREERIDVPKKMLHTKMEGIRPRGRPRTRWIDQIKKDIEMGGANLEEIQKKYLKWENRDASRFLSNSRPRSLETT